MSTATGPPDPHSLETEARILCYVCETDLTETSSKEEQTKKKGIKAGKADLKPGLVELRSEGTGFAGGGDNMVQRQGTAFQC